MKTILSLLAVTTLGVMAPLSHAGDACKKCCKDNCAACCKDAGKACGKDCCKAEK